ncbi:MAG: hypothetical protein ACR2LT_09960 [Pyrinomonadaceae bacterium]
MSATWTQLNIFAIGGLIQVGFAPQSDYLLVVSHQGRGVFDCISGQKIARDANETWWQYFDEATLLAEGIGLLEGRKIRTAGLFGGSLSKTTGDSWKLFEQSEGINQIFLKHESWSDSEAKVVGDDEVCEMRSFGFSETGNSFIIATSCDVTIYTRGNAEQIIGREGETASL